MASTFPIPLQTFDPAHGVYTFGPQSVAPNDSKIVMTVDRTVTGGLNSLDSSSGLYIEVDQSNDGGNTWFVAIGSGLLGGQYFRPPPPKDTGALQTQTQLIVDVYGSGPGRQLRVTVTAFNNPVAIAGTLAVS